MINTDSKLLKPINALKKTSFKAIKTNECLEIPSLIGIYFFNTK